MVTLEEINREKKRDRRIRRSKELILDALLHLIKKTGYEKVTIKEIAEKAAVSRATFYRIYQNKDDILLHYLDEMFEEYFSTVFLLLQREKDHHVAGRILLQGWKDREEFFLAIQKANLSLKLLERFIDYSFFMLDQTKQNSSDDDNRFHRYIAHYSAGGIFMMLYCWLQDHSNPSIQDLEKVLGNYIKFEIEMIRSFS